MCLASVETFELTIQVNLGGFLIEVIWVKFLGTDTPFSCL